MHASFPIRTPASRAPSAALYLHLPLCQTTARHHASRPDPNAPDLDDDGHLEPDFPCTLAPFAVVAVVAVEDF
jgi:hypothetical protein